MKSKAQSIIGGLISLYILLEYGKKAICILSEAIGCESIDGWGDSMIVIFIALLLLPTTLTIKNKIKSPTFWTLAIYTLLIVLSIPVGNKIKIPMISIASALLLNYLVTALIKAIKSKTVANKAQA
ncbi:hypothetical protein H8S95_05735 [Pontibacter sp. KCTC 32443]|uniref:hypothetical protein n=1 Tax=Pontibacter TaxID=323449 RepID=UPI00164DF1EF|nr:MULTISPECIES: hypothetical protein [Pontibacter]MBC5773557.1 hypothetical protein [Pontibacter sp. KCTC 32443]